MSRPILLSLLAFAAVLASPPAGASAAPNQVMTFEAPSELLDDDQRDATLDEIRSLGVTNVRALVYWRDYAPRPRSTQRPAFVAEDPAAYGDAWGPLDRLFAAASARQITVQLTLTGPVPRWATKGVRDQVTQPDPRAFEEFVEAVGRRYGEQVSVWSIWNEPNHPDFLKPQYDSRDRPASPAHYRRLFLAARRGLAASGNADDTVLLGETSPIGGPRVVRPLAFLRGTLCLSPRWRPTRSCAPLDADGYAHHPYTKRSGPRYVPPHRDNVTIGVLSRLERALDRAAAADALPPRLPLYLTEFGIQSVPDCYAGVSLSEQAEYLAIAERMAYLNRRVAAFSQYLLRDDRPRPAARRCARYSGFETGLRGSDGRRKPAYAAFRLPLVATNYGRFDVLWGRARPATERTNVLVQARTGRRWRDVGQVTTNASGVFGTRVEHRRGQRYRIRWTGPDGRTLTGASVRAYRGATPVR